VGKGVVEARHDETTVRLIGTVAEQIVGPDTSYPGLHAGWHEVPAAMLLPHVPRLPLAGAATVHADDIVGLQTVTAVSVVPVGAQTVGPVTAYPPLHAGWHEVPAAMLLPHVPRLPLAGAATVHVGLQTVTAVSVVPVGAQTVGPDAAYPPLHAGWHEVPGAMLLPHVPRLPLAGAATAQAVLATLLVQTVTTVSVLVPD